MSVNKSGASGNQQLNQMKKTLQQEVEAEFLKYLESMRTRMLVADVEESLVLYAEKYSQILAESSDKTNLD